MQSSRIDALSEGTILHAYRIKSELGSGAFGITYLAEHTLLNTLHVIKEYLPESALRDRATSTVTPKSHQEEDLFNWGMTSFFNEARILNQLSHPNIVKVSDLFEANGTAYFVMPYLKGITLHEWIKSNKNPNQQQLEQLFVPILEGLKYIHERNLLHRDIKPENIYITDNGNPVLIDFGAARLAIGNKSKALTQVLTPHFAPWEQYRSKGDFTPALDLYSLAGCMYQAIAQKLPEEAPNRLEDDPQPKLSGSEHEGRFDHEFLTAIDTALSVWAKDRYQNAFDFQKGLLGQVASEAPAAAPSAQQEAPVVPEPKENKPESSAESKSKTPAIIGGGLAAVIAVGAVLWFTVLSPSDEEPDQGDQVVQTSDTSESETSDIETAQVEEEETVDEAWLTAQEADTIAGYENYLSECAECAHQGDAESRLAELRQIEADRIAQEQADAAERERRQREQRQRDSDAQLFTTARQTDSIESYRDYLSECQLCEDRRNAQNRIGEIERAQQTAEQQAAAEEAARQGRQRDAVLWSSLDGSITGYQRYLNSCEVCEQEDQAEQAIAEIEAERAAMEREDALYAAVNEEGTVEAMQAYLDNCVRCVAKEDVEVALQMRLAQQAQLEGEQALWDAAIAADDVSSYQEYLTNCEVCENQETAERRLLRLNSSSDGLTVAPSGADFSNLQEAVDFALPGTVIRVMPGQYAGPVRIEKDVSLVGQGERSEVQLIADEQDALYLIETNARIENLTVRTNSRQQLSYAVFIDGGSPQLINNEIISDSASVIAVNNSATPRIDGNNIHGSRQSGIVIYNNSVGEYVNNLIHDNTEFGLRLETATNPTIQSNRIYSNRQGGVIIIDGGTGNFADNEIYDNEIANVIVTADARPTFTENLIRGSNSNGIFIFSGGSGTFNDNVISGNTDFGIRIENDVNPTFSGNTVTGNQRGGVLVLDNARGEFENNTITQNLSAGVLVTASGNPTFSGNVISENEQHGVHIFDQGRGQFTNNEISNNPLYGVVIRNGGSPVFENNRIENNREGIGFLSSAGGTVNDNDIRDNEVYGVVVRGDSAPEITNNRIRSNQQGGVAVLDNGRGTFSNNTIASNGFAGFLVTTGGSPSVVNNEISQSSESGLFIRDNATGEYRDNDIHDNGFSGIAVRSGANPTVVGNSIYMNREGIRVYDSGRGTYQNNEISGNMNQAWDISDDSSPVRQ
ncbi:MULTISPECIES: right-handed parallel beta-helix repeat-containing protein [Gammaproteobacteria]|uniref:right-handed parallel beta-helix repeat-containing protein n=1 Tax=Gammaproteobacteria TaxID=1236 RepID=UPI000DCFDF57|nr:MULTISPECIES: right-handed parallel beta-helix repeat-containing protein [Gammaproteobacteria]RTE87231.1 hypothetical protein DQX04_02250 [Aliidiomarina sp. B3213]TCZ92981.1 hypothetical protein EYQ95_03055 [Lysobacter sp. N42]